MNKKDIGNGCFLLKVGRLCVFFPGAFCLMTAYEVLIIFVCDGLLKSDC